MTKIHEFYAKRRRFIIGSVIFTAASWVSASIAVSSFRSEHRIGIDLNEVRCLPWRIYFITYGRPALAKGTYVAFIARNGVMGPRFEGKLIGKQVAAVAGDRVIVKNDILYINGIKTAPLYLIKRLNATPGQFDRDEIVPSGKILALGTEPHSYDGRYWGWLDTGQIIAKVEPLI